MANAELVESNYSNICVETELKLVELYKTN